MLLFKACANTQSFLLKTEAILPLSTTEVDISNTIHLSPVEYGLHRKYCFAVRYLGMKYIFGRNAIKEIQLY